MTFYSPTTVHLQILNEFWLRLLFIDQWFVDPPRQLDPPRFYQSVIPRLCDESTRFRCHDRFSIISKWAIHHFRTLPIVSILRSHGSIREPCDMDPIPFLFNYFSHRRYFGSRPDYIWRLFRRICDRAVGYWGYAFLCIFIWVILILESPRFYQSPVPTAQWWSSGIMRQSAFPFIPIGTPSCIWTQSGFVSNVIWPYHHFRSHPIHHILNRDSPYIFKI